MTTTPLAKQRIGASPSESGSDPLKAGQSHPDHGQDHRNTGRCAAGGVDTGRPPGRRAARPCRAARSRQGSAMNPADVLTLTEQLTERDVAALRTLRSHRLATTTQLQRWHFTAEPPGGFADRRTALRVAQRVLRRLERHRLVARLYQRIGGVRRGSDSTVWQLDVRGDRLLSVLDGDKRRRYVEPRKAFVAHTIAVTELATRLVEATSIGRLEGATLTGEPANWKRFTGRHGQMEILKPDLQAVTVFGDYEDHWLFEMDRATEHPGVVVRKAQIYERYAATGAYQTDHGVFPAVLWVVPDEARQQALKRALRAARGIATEVHRVITDADFVPTVLAGSAPPDHTNQPHTDVGINP